MGSDKLFQKRKKKAEVDLQRREEQRLTTITILIVGEGVTEYNYFNEMRRILRRKGINIILEKPRGSAPISIVDSALNVCERNEDIDYAFCVFDQDEHTSFHGAVDKLNRYNLLNLKKANQSLKPLHLFLVLKSGLLFILPIPLKVILEVALNLLVIMFMTIY